ncbi:tyrosine-type recombinase/integrase [Yokenella regensburgei]|uniref:tyrosine-type recombinase/integrase n=1 Tax=Yokenella regensburgei TaxID=158877 RepID=UPI0013757B9C|nr:tyrosine-type recombinase/integrase [Yokenella regensburgei]KAF1366433.1 integrase [Yokenella regensburgei]
MNNVIPLQNSPERVSLLPIAPGVDFATAVALRRMATASGVTPAYLLAPEVSALLYYMPDQRHHMLFATMWNTGIRIGEARTLTPESFDLGGLRPFVQVLSEKVHARRGRPPKDEVRLVPLTDGVFLSVPVTPHTFRHSYIMHMLYHRQPKKVIQSLVGHRDPRSMEVYTRVFALELTATLTVPFTGDGRDGADILRSLPPPGQS